MDQHDFKVVNTCDTEVNAFQCVQNIPEKDGVFQSGWASSKDHGHKYRRKYIEPFKDDIMQMFKDGIDDERKRKFPGRMLSVLRAKYPGRLDLPSESEIRQAIAVMMVKLKKGQAHDLTKRRGDIEPYLTTLMQIFQNPEGNIRSAEAWQQFQCTEITMTTAQRNSK